MTDFGSFIVVSFMVFIPLIVGVVTKLRESQTESQPIYSGYRITIEPVECVSVEKEVKSKNRHQDTALSFDKEAKTILMSFGFTAAESKQLISEAGPCRSVDELVQAALMRTKI
jgi:hypothetical protein